MVEAMLCGRPVVATNVAGHAEIMIHGKTGFLADAPTPASVSAALELFWANREHWQQLGRADAARARELVPRDPIGVFAKKIMALIS
jgi:glycosyltransferase involved in cell wall biosynthesis